jgi:hypothetical protein
MNNLLNNVEKIRVANSATAAQTEVDGTAVDLANADGVVFTAALGDVTTGSVLGLKAQVSDTGVGDWADVVGSALTFTAGASDADSKLLVIDVVKPTKRYARAVLTRTTANAVVDGIFAEVYGKYSVPVTQGTTVLASVTVPNAHVA